MSAVEQPNPQKKTTRDGVYYKSIMNASKEIKGALKEIKMARIDSGLDQMKKVLELLAPYSDI